MTASEKICLELNEIGIKLKFSRVKKSSVKKSGHNLALRQRGNGNEHMFTNETTHCPSPAI